ncbi:MAG: hypothetical protein ABI210_14280, partial [Abditibacteriaceae bacterium]
MIRNLIKKAFIKGLLGVALAGAMLCSGCSNQASEGPNAAKPGSLVKLGEPPEPPKTDSNSAMNSATLEPKGNLTPDQKKL